MTANKRGRPPLFGTPMTDAQHQARRRAKVAREARLSPQPVPPEIAHLPTGDEMLAALGYDLPMMSNERLAELRAQPGGADWDDPDQPEIGADGEPIFPDSIPPSR
jgi:hypothetical protein